MKEKKIDKSRSSSKEKNPGRRKDSSSDSSPQPKGFALVMKNAEINSNLKDILPF